MIDTLVARNNLTIDGQPPVSVLSPATEAECIEVINGARLDKKALVPVGGGTAIDVGNRLDTDRWFALSTDSLTSTFDYSPEDMVITAGAGITAASLQESLAKHGQFLPIDIPSAERATLGGMVATNGHGLWRSGYGAPRDHLLGVRVVLPDGSVVRGGGKVVKNVAGYDLCKLFAGSWSTLGLITEVTFKTRPLPAVRTSISFEGLGFLRLAEVGLAIRQARLDPIYAVAHDQRFPKLTVGLHGSERAVKWQRGQILGLAREIGLRETESGLGESALRELLGCSGGRIRVRISVRSSDSPTLCESLAPMSENLICDVLAGLIVADVALPESAPPGEFLAVAEKIGLLSSGQIRITWLALPESLKDHVDVWGSVPGGFGLMKAMKEAVDPERIFSPGRFIGRL